MKLHPVYFLFTLIASLLLGCAKPESAEPEHAAHAEVEKGSHGGRLLKDGDFSVELAIFETGVPPEFHAWVTHASKPLPVEQVQLSVELVRLDGERDLVHFTPQQDFLRGDATVHEPHSFSVTVTANHAGTEHRWQYDSFEGRTSIPAASAQAAGIAVAKAGPQFIRDVLPLYGRVTLNPEAVREVSARFPGTVTQVAVALGQRINAGAVLARVESSDSLQEYAVTAPISGVITERRTNAGEHAGANALFVISDLSQRWVELSVFPRDVARLKSGQQVRLAAVDGAQRSKAEIVRMTPAGIGNDQALKVWARLESSSELVPGQYVNAEVMVGGTQAALAVRAEALQAFRDFSVVFARVADTYEVRMLELGRSDGEYVEVLNGLKPDTEYVTANSYLIKADIEKSGASHDH